MWRVSVGGGLACVAWVGWVVYLCGWHGSVDGMSGVLTWMACYYHFHYYWNTILKSKMLNVYFWSKNEKMFQKDLNSDLKEEPDLKSSCWFTLFGPAMRGSWICLNLLKYTPMWASIPRYQERNYINMPEICHAWNIMCLNKSKF